MYSPEDWGGEYHVRVLDNMNGYLKLEEGYPIDVDYSQVGQDIGAITLRNKDEFMFRPKNCAYPWYYYLAINSFNLNTGELDYVYNYIYVNAGKRVDPSEAYLAWGGTWIIDGNEITITPVENSEIWYTVSGLHPNQEVKVEAEFDMETENIIIYGYQYGQGDAEYTKDGHKYHYYLVGKTEDGGLMVWGEPIATLVKSADGQSAEIKPGTYPTDEMGGTAEYSAFGLAGNYSPTDDWDWESENAVWYELPNTMERPSASAQSVARRVVKPIINELQQPNSAEAPAKGEKPMTLKEFRANLNK